ncbi:MAG: hypothetical protein ACQEVA_00555 [Myxococcota bacterium]
MSEGIDISSGVGRRVVQLLLICATSMCVGACDFRQPVCVSDSECRSDFVCSSSSGYCEPDWDAMSQSDPDPEPDVMEEDTGHGEDTRDVEEETGEDTVFIPSACVGEVDDVGCSRRGEPNDSPREAADMMASGFGCTGGANDFRDLDTVKSAGLCGRDSADYYSLEYVECRDREFRIDVILDPHPETCPHKTYSLSIEIEGTRYACSPDESVSNSNARCTTLSDGGRQLTAFIDADSMPAVQFALIAVESEAESGSAFFDYDMRVRLY